ncbi:MAG: hypothetical protein QM650_18095 [Microlunatus sp.]
MWLNLEVGAARSLRRLAPADVDVPSADDSGRYGRRALVVEAAHTYFPEAVIESLPELARTEIAAGLGGELRSRIAETDEDDPTLQRLCDRLVTRLGGTADVNGALTLVDRVYAGRLLRRQVPPIVTASCVAWHGHWRSTNGGPFLGVAEELRRAMENWIADPRQRPDLDVQIIAGARQLAGNYLVALEDAVV